MKGTLTQLSILTMPADDIGHPIPDLTGYITEGQIVLSRDLDRRAIYPPIDVLPSLSRLMKDGTGGKYTHPDHPALSSQLYAAYARAVQARVLASVVGEEGLAATDRQYLAFGTAFEDGLVSQSEPRTLEQSMEVGWQPARRPAADRAHAPVRRADRRAPAGEGMTRDMSTAVACRKRRSRMSEASPTRAVVLELKDEQRAMHEGYVFLDEKCLLLAGEILRELARYAELDRALLDAHRMAIETLQAAVARHGLDDLQVYPPLDQIVCDARTRRAVDHGRAPAGRHVAAGGRCGAALRWRRHPKRKPAGAHSLR